MPTFVGFTCNKGETMEQCNFHLVPRFKECSPNIFINEDRLFVMLRSQTHHILGIVNFFGRKPMNYHITLLSNYNVINSILIIIK